ncbi:MAG: ATP-dependent helicase [bacterium]|nr:ATP-dependent helicase [bacterium]
MTFYDDLYKKLNDNQRLAVDHIDGPMMVLAGAGTGKTQVLAMRIANLMRTTGVGINNILCLTFTEAGVAAMRERLIRILGSEGHGAKVATFHSFSNEVMSEYPEKFIKTAELLPISELERVRFLTQILEGLPYGNPLKHVNNPVLYLNDISSRISELKREGVNPERLDHFIHEQQLFATRTKDLFESMIGTHAGQYTETLLDEIADGLVELGKTIDGSDYLYRSAGILLIRARELASLNPTKTGKISYAKLKEDMKRFYLQVSGKIEHQKALNDIYRSYLSVLEENGRYDFEDMINNVLGILTLEENMRRDFQERYQYVLVDEYQDTNTAQNSLVDVFGHDVESPNIFVVGDDDQSIFRFQGASLENVVGFAQHYGDTAKVISLTHNYRSQPVILSVADLLIQNNQFRAAVAIPNVVKSLMPGLILEPKAVRVLTFSDTNSEQYWIAREIRELLDHGAEPHEIAVLGKTNTDLVDLVPFIKKYEIPYSLSRNENAFENVIVNQFLRLILAIRNPYDNQNFFFLLESAIGGIPALEFLRINRYVLSHPRSGIQYFDFIGNTSLLQEAGVIDTISCNALFQNVIRWREFIGSMTPMEVISDIVSTSGILDQCSNSGENELDNLRALGALVSEFGREIQSKRTSTFDDLVQLSIDMLEHNLPLTLGDRGSALGRISLTTVHKSKGLEYGHVFIMNALERKWEKGGRGDRLPLPLNLFENDLGVAARQQEEEARRLFYVAVTRAKHDLVISYSNSDKDGKKQLPTQFISELGEEGIQREVIILSSPAQKETLLMRLIGLKRPESYEEETQSFLRERLADYSVSASHLNAYRKCPRMFYYQYFIRAPIVPDSALVVGTAAHKAVEALFESNLHGAVISADEMVAIYEKMLERSFLTGSKYTDALERGRLFLPKYYAYRANNLPAKIKIETDFSYHGICLEDIRLTGKIDMIEFTEQVSRQCVVYDFKTGDAAKAAKRVAYDEDIWRQIVFYKLLTKMSRRFGFVMERGIVEFVEPGKDGNFTTVEVNVTDSDLEVVKGQIKEMWQELQSLNFRCREPIGECQYCRNILKVGDGEGF